MKWKVLAAAVWYRGIGAEALAEHLDLLQAAGIMPDRIIVDEIIVL